jgi:COP9 signalosome complex subunit 1
MGNEDLGKHYQSIGELSKAFEAFSRMRQDVSLPKHIVEVSLHLIEVTMEQKNFMAVASNVAKIRSTQIAPEDQKAIEPFLDSAEGLARLDAKNYHDAAMAFISIPSGMGSDANNIISPNDVAIYGGLCALASMDRKEMQAKVLDNSNFRSYLELEPHVRRAIGFFVNSRYSACLSTLETYRSDYLLDIHLQKHVNDIYYLVRSKCIVQYFIPFSCVTLDSLNAAFAAPGSTIDKELVQMIRSGELDARIDTINRVSSFHFLYPSASS